MGNTVAQDVFKSFEASFQDKSIIPEELELEWLLKAIGRYSVELDPLNFDTDTLSFDQKLDRYIIDTLGAFMKQSYQEREVSKVNKRVSIVGKDISIDGNNGSKTAAREELNYDSEKSSEMISNRAQSAHNHFPFFIFHSAAIGCSVNPNLPIFIYFIF